MRPAVNAANMFGTEPSGTMVTSLAVRPTVVRYLRVEIPRPDVSPVTPSDLPLRSLPVLTSFFAHTWNGTPSSWHPMTLSLSPLASSPSVSTAARLLSGVLPATMAALTCVGSDAGLLTDNPYLS